MCHGMLMLLMVALTRMEAPCCSAWTTKVNETANLKKRVAIDLSASSQCSQRCRGISHFLCLWFGFLGCCGADDAAGYIYCLRH